MTKPTPQETLTARQVRSVMRGMTPETMPPRKAAGVFLRTGMEAVAAQTTAVSSLICRGARYPAPLLLFLP